jgi:ABC-type Fe3+/spermidine/putrescine transport system ATPase subunit
MDAGKILQYGAPDEIYNRPAHPFVASFVGHSALVDGRVVRVEGENCLVNIPEFNGANLVSPAPRSAAAGERLQSRYPHYRSQAQPRRISRRRR